MRTSVNVLLIPQVGSIPMLTLHKTTEAQLKREKGEREKDSPTGTVVYCIGIGAVVDGTLQTNQHAVEAASDHHLSSFPPLPPSSFPHIPFLLSISVPAIDLTHSYPPRIGRRRHTYPGEHPTLPHYCTLSPGTNEHQKSKTDNGTATGSAGCGSAAALIPRRKAPVDI